MDRLDNNYLKQQRILKMFIDNVRCDITPPPLTLYIHSSKANLLKAHKKEK